MSHYSGFDKQIVQFSSPANGKFNFLCSPTAVLSLHTIDPAALAMFTPRITTVYCTAIQRRDTYCVDGGQGEGEVEVVAVVDVSVPHELQVLVSHHLQETQTERSDDSSLCCAALRRPPCPCYLATPYLIDAGRHLLHKQALLLSLAHQAGEEGEAVVVGPGGSGRGLW